MTDAMKKVCDAKFTRMRELAIDDPGQFDTFETLHSPDDVFMAHYGLTPDNKPFLHEIGAAECCNQAEPVDYLLRRVTRTLN